MRNRGKWSTAFKLSSLCIVLKKAVYESIGGISESFGLSARAHGVWVMPGFEFFEGNYGNMPAY